MVMSLDRLRPGGDATILQMQVSGTMAARMRDFGMIPGSRVQCRYRSPGGKVTALEIMGAVIAFRTRELKNILVESL